MREITYICKNLDKREEYKNILHFFCYNLDDFIQYSIYLKLGFFNRIYLIY